MIPQEPTELLPLEGRRGEGGRLAGQPTPVTMAALCPTPVEEPVLSKEQTSAMEVEVGAGTVLKLGMRLWLNLCWD